MKQGVEMQTANSARRAPVAGDASMQRPRGAAQDDASALPLDTRLKQSLSELAELKVVLGTSERKVMALQERAEMMRLAQKRHCRKSTAWKMSLE
jgi:hypothetical protein